MGFYIAPWVTGRLASDLCRSPEAKGTWVPQQEPGLSYVRPLMQKYKSALMLASIPVALPRPRVSKTLLTEGRWPSLGL